MKGTKQCRVTIVVTSYCDFDSFTILHASVCFSALLLVHIANLWQLKVDSIVRTFCVVKLLQVCTVVLQWIYNRRTVKIVYRHCGPRTLWTQDTSDLPNVGPRTLRHVRSVPTLRHWCRNVFGVQTLWTQDTSAWPKCLDTSALMDVSALDSLSTYMEDQSHCRLCDSFLPLVTLRVSVGQFEFEYYAKVYPWI